VNNLYSKEKIKENTSTGTLLGYYILNQDVTISVNCPYCKINTIIPAKFRDSVIRLCKNCKRGIKVEIKDDSIFFVS
jgi:hypothetical protein